MNWKNLIVCLLFTLFLTEMAMAWPRLRRRRSYRSSSVSSYRQRYDDQYRDLPKSPAIYDWAAIAKIDAADYIPIVLDDPING